MKLPLVWNWLATVCPRGPGDGAFRNWEPPLAPGLPPRIWLSVFVIKYYNGLLWSAVKRKLSMSKQVQVLSTLKWWVPIERERVFGGKTVCPQKILRLAFYCKKSNFYSIPCQLKLSDDFGYWNRVNNTFMWSCPTLHKKQILPLSFCNVSPFFMMFFFLP